MRRHVKKFVASAFHVGKNRDYVRKSLFGKVSDIEVSKALRHFDKLCRYKEGKGRVCFRDIPKLFFYPFKLFFLFLVYISFKFSFFIRRIFLGQSEDITFEEVKRSFGFVSLLKDLKIWVSKRSKREKKRIVFLALLIVFSLLFISFASFYFYKHCDTSVCFKEMVSKCSRAEFISRDVVSLENKIIGLSFRGCKIEVTSLDNQLSIDVDEKMTCYFPYGLKVLPQAKIEFCSGSLREGIQEVIISELYKTVGQNVPDLNSFFRQGRN